MQVTETREGDVVVLTIDGRLDASTAVAFEEKIVALMDGGAERVVIDGAAISYISSAGLRVFLVAAKRLATAAGGGFAIGALQPQVREVFDVAGFSSILSIHDTRAEAVAQVS